MYSKISITNSTNNSSQCLDGLQTKPHWEETTDKTIPRLVEIIATQEQSSSLATGTTPRGIANPTKTKRLQFAIRAIFRQPRKGGITITPYKRSAVMEYTHTLRPRGTRHRACLKKSVICNTRANKKKEKTTIKTRITRSQLKNLQFAALWTESCRRD